MTDDIRNELRRAFAQALAKSNASIEELDKAFNTYARFEERLSELDKHQ